MHNIKKLKIWNDSIDLCVDVYEALANMPNDEKYGLSSQIKRAAVSISSNIAEGAGREREKEFYYFLNIAYGSSYELQTQLILCEKLKFISSEINKSLLDRLNDVQKMIYVFKENINKRII
ncbi:MULTISPECIES: four helix bundle protein [Chryseobacterium]|jgi:four helix bundle protein|uniref:Four helix bundle protein n=1 Tax=Chryseobacterium piscium TaxID=333702 RepID=A0A3D9BSE4_9FLAO|nr:MULTISPECIES: four helix bundle protein [Chryseobacterium]REC44393.1 four helix bundle protein [Chryseobacterium sp. 5_R23647]REC56454.1 four helix bundle protein [Chryseobacterium piscium]